MKQIINAMDIERNLCARGAVLVIFNVLTLSPEEIVRSFHESRDNDFYLFFMLHNILKKVQQEELSFFLFALLFIETFTLFLSFPQTQDQ